jgi:hypothetical protein
MYIASSSEVIGSSGVVGSASIYIRGRMYDRVWGKNLQQIWFAILEPRKVLMDIRTHEDGILMTQQ